ncbi:MAG TPA: hypothetical protein VFE28_15300 [Candidatus Krumholzibacteria bacterium]|jgi:hypothetical protein|nr:hypothetical protein [Candidatus Krumholzibacteria bacterium]
MKTLFVAIVTLAFAPGAASADQIVANVDGLCPENQTVSFQATIGFTATGGNFASGTGTATVTFTIENTSGVFPFQSPALGNPVLTGFFFNVPPGTGVSLTGATILAGSSIVSTGTVYDGVPIPAACTTLVADQGTTWYHLEGSSATGGFGIFTNGVTTLEGVKAGLVDPQVYAACVAQGDVFSPLVVAGTVRYTLSLTNLGTTLDSAADFRNICTLPQGGHEASWLAGKFQATGTNGEESCFVAEPCLLVPIETWVWGGVKGLYR